MLSIWIDPMFLLSVCMHLCVHVCVFACVRSLVCLGVEYMCVCVFHKDAASPTHITKKSTEERDLYSQPEFSVGIANQQESPFCQSLGTKDVGNTRPWAGQI